MITPPTAAALNIEEEDVVALVGKVFALSDDVGTLTLSSFSPQPRQ